MSNSRSIPPNDEQTKSAGETAQPRHPASKSRVWTWLVMLLGLALFAVTLGIIWYRSRYPLTATRLQEARELWKQHGPANYNLLITIEGRMPGTYYVEVREGRVVRAVQRLANGGQTDILTVTLPDGRTLRREAQEWTVPGLFDWLESDLQRDQASGNVYTFVLFDSYDGHLIEYVRSAPSQHYRLRVQLTRLE